MYKLALAVFIAPLLFFSCNNSDKYSTGEIPVGIWRAVIYQQGKELPFNFEINKSAEVYSLIIHNGEERIPVEEITKKDDSLIIQMPYFDSGFRLKYSDGKLSGNFHKYYADDYVLPMEAIHGESKRFHKNCTEPEIDINGNWEVNFEKKDGSKYPAVGKFSQNGYLVTGTFLTETGDYRYLEGNIVRDKLQLSCFDGNHLFLFEGNIVGNKIMGGEFWHGKNTYEKWVGEKNETAALTSPYDLTYLKPGFDKLAFSFPDLDSSMISLDDSLFKNKAVLVQIFGSWCPNCVDESKFLSKWYDENRDKKVEIVGLAYEAKPDFQYAKSRVKNLKGKLGINYKFLIAGTYDKEEAAKTLPMLNHVLSFPTLIFINKNGKVQKIHTGFNGPGTGESYDQFVEEFDKIINDLIGISG